VVISGKCYGSDGASFGRETKPVAMAVAAGIVQVFWQWTWTIASNFNRLETLLYGYNLGVFCHKEMIGFYFIYANVFENQDG
jgi:hypothetical protein